MPAEEEEEDLSYLFNYFLSFVNNYQNIFRIPLKFNQLNFL